MTILYYSVKDWTLLVDAPPLCSWLNIATLYMKSPETHILLSLGHSRKVVVTLLGLPDFVLVNAFSRSTQTLW